MRRSTAWRDDKHGNRLAVMVAGNLAAINTYGDGYAVTKTENPQVFKLIEEFALALAKAADEAEK